MTESRTFIAGGTQKEVGLTMQSSEMSSVTSLQTWKNTDGADKHVSQANLEEHFGGSPTFPVMH